MSRIPCSLPKPVRIQNPDQLMVKLNNKRIRCIIDKNEIYCSWFEKWIFCDKMTDSVTQANCYLELFQKKHNKTIETKHEVPFYSNNYWPTDQSSGSQPSAIVPKVLYPIENLKWLAEPRLFRLSAFYGFLIDYLSIDWNHITITNTTSKQKPPYYYIYFSRE